MTQLGEVYQNTRSSARRSQCSAICLRVSTRKPPWPCTSPFGRPVVPDEKSTHMGWSKGTTTGSSEAVPATASSHESQSPAGRVASRFTMTTWSIVPSPSRISPTASTRLCSRPLNR